MGYTHFWSKNTKAKEKIVSATFKKNILKSIDIMGKIVKDSNLVAGWDGNGEPKITKNEIRFNGFGKMDSHETFSIKSSWKGDFQLCKTARKPYDIVVVACLAVLKHYCGESVSISSDGKNDDYSEPSLDEGVALAEKYIPELDTSLKNLFKDN